MNKLSMIFVAFLFFMFSCSKSDDSSSTSNNSSTRTWTDVAYASASNTQKLDIYLPATGDGPFPVVIWIHGGAFKMGSKANPQSQTTLNNNGFAVVSINYRLSGEAKWPAQLEDLKSVVKFLRTNASTYKINPDKIGAWGASAGGHLAAMTGIALSLDATTKIQATVDWFGPIDFFQYGCRHSCFGS